MKRKSPKRRLALVALLALIVAASAYAFTASNTVPASAAGDGSGVISGYTVTAVAYVLATDPSNIDKVTFTIAPATASQVKAKVVSGSTTYTNCTNTAGAVTCDFSPDVSVLSADQLRVIATS